MLMKLTLVWNRIHRVIREVGARFIGSACGTRALPTTDINGRQVRCHLDYLDWIQSTESVGIPALGMKGGQELVEFPR